MRTHLCGIRTAWTDAADAALAVAEIAQLVVFFSPEYEPAALNRALAAPFPDAATAGCTMSGGFSPAGGLDRGLVVIAFPAKGFRIVSTVLDALGHLDVERTASSVRSLRRTLEPHGPDHMREGRFALSLIDGLTDAEETVVSAIAWALDGIPLVG